MVQEDQQDGPFSERAVGTRREPGHWPDMLMCQSRGGENATIVSKPRQWIFYMKYLFSGRTSALLAGTANLEYLAVTGPENPVRDGDF